MVKATDQSIDAGIVKANNEFALNLYAATRQRRGNLFFSPYGIFSALAMVYAGARGETALQMSRGLHLLLDQAQVHPGFAALNNRLRSAGPADSYLLTMANALKAWGSERSFRTECRWPSPTPLISVAWPIGVTYSFPEQFTRPISM